MFLLGGTLTLNKLQFDTPGGGTEIFKRTPIKESWV